MGSIFGRLRYVLLESRCIFDRACWNLTLSTFLRVNGCFGHRTRRHLIITRLKQVKLELRDVQRLFYLFRGENRCVQNFLLLIGDPFRFSFVHQEGRIVCKGSWRNSFFDFNQIFFYCDGRRLLGDFDLLAHKLEGFYAYGFLSFRNSHRTPLELNFLTAIH